MSDPNPHIAPTQQAAPASRTPGPRDPRRRRQRASRFSERNLLRNPLPLAAAAITVLLVTLILLAARLSAGADPALHPITAGGIVNAQRAPAAHGGSGNQVRTILRTTASGRTFTETVRGGGGSAAREPFTQGGSSTLRTRSSGGEAGPDD